MRLFVGLRPSEAAIADLAEFTTRLRLGDVRATALDTWHLTLAFIGEIDEYRLDDVHTALAESGGGGEGFELRLTGGRILGRAATALCVGVDGDLPALRDLVAQVRTGLTRFQVPFDDRPFKAHLTLARTRDAALASELSAKAALLDEYRGRPWTATEVILYRSRLGPPVSYETVATYALRRPLRRA